MTTAIAVTISVLIALASGTVLLSLRDRRVAKARRGESYEDFQRHFAAQATDETILTSVYQYFESWMCNGIVTDFPVRPTDDIYGIYGIVDKDFDDMLDELLKETGRRMPDENEMHFPAKLQTVEDIVHFINQCPK